MKRSAGTGRAIGRGEPGWIRYALIILVIEKIVQHLVVTTAFLLNWNDIGSRVAVNPSVLMVVGAIVAILFMVGLWGTIARKTWAVNLVIGLALFDIIGEFVAQGTLFIAITVSVVVATVLLILGLIDRRQQARAA